MQQQAGVPVTKSRGFVFWMVLAALSCSLFPANSFAQQDSRDKFDRDFYESYTDQITSRLFFSQKYTSLRIRGEDKTKDLQYRPNTTLNFGVGATYGWFTLNLAYGFDFLNRADKSKGKTNYLDLQSHIYPRKMSIDLFGQIYKGFYAYPQEIAPHDGKSWYQRPDIRVQHFGAAAYYILNWRKLSLRAGMLQNEWQKRSAGSLLLGGEFYYGQNKGDSALVPLAIQDQYKQAGVTKMRYMDIGPGIGYAYTFVMQEHWYALGVLSSSFPISFHKQWRNGETEHKLSISPDLLTRLGIGYNSSRMNISMMWINSNVQTKGKNGEYAIRTGNVRLNAAYRFIPGAKLKRKLKLFEEND